MITSLTAGSPAPPPDHPEWWELQQSRRQHREADHPSRIGRAARARAALSWAALACVVIGAVADAAVRAGLGAFTGAFALFLLWFLIARTKTLSWRAVVAVFASAATWAVIVIAAQPFTDLVGEDALLLVPLAALVIAVPGRVCRFSVSDWLLTGAALGAAYQAVEASALAAARELGAPAATAVSAGTGARSLVFPLLGVGIGLGVATARHGRRLRGNAAIACQVLGGVLPVMALAVLIGARRPAGVDLPVVPHGVWAPGPSGTVATLALVVLVTLAHLIDTRRMRATDEPGTDRIPYPFSPADTADGWTLTLIGPGNAGRGSPALHLLTAGIWAACCMVTYLARDLLVIVGAHLRDPKEPVTQAVPRGRAAITLTRVLRPEAFHPLDAPGGIRPFVRAGGIAAVFSLLAGGLLLSGRRADGAPEPWLATAGDALGQGVSQLSLGGALAAVALAGVLVLITGAPGTPAGQDGGRRLLLDRGPGVTHFSRSGSPAERLATSTVAELVLDAVAAIATLIPKGVLQPVVRSAAGGPARAVVAEFCADPARLIARKRRQLSAAPDDTGAILAVRTGSWDTGSRRRWVDSRVTSRTYRVSSADGRTSVPAAGLSLAADGVAMLESTHLHHPGAPMLFEGQAPALLAERLLAPFDDEMRRYATVIRDPHNPVTRLRLVVGSQPAADLLGTRARGILGADLDMIIVVDPVED